VSASHDRHFFDTFMLVLGVLIAIAIALWILARVVAGRTQDVHVRNDPEMQQRIEARIEPFARVAVAGQDNSALAAPAASQTPEPAAAQTAAAADMSGEQVYNMACIACHGQGIGGAPKIGDAGAWAPRIAKGMDTLHQHSIEGFQGSAGYMPPKGGRVDLSDDAVMAAVDYMVEASR
jgi:cytochrome c5